MTEPCCLLVCGGGNGAHVLAGLGAADSSTEVRVLTMFRDEAERWTNTMKDNPYQVHFKIHGKEQQKLNYKPDVVSKDPAIAKGCNLIVLVVPAFGHAQYLEAIKPYISPGTTIVGMPGQAGFEFDVRGILGDVAKQCTLISFESLPWACRIASYGKDVEVLGTKAVLSGAVDKGVVPSSLKDPVAKLQHIIGEHPKLNVFGHILGMTLMAVNAYVHPAILFGRWHNHDGTPVEEAPLFYQGLDQFSADTMTALSDEAIAVAKAIMKAHPDVDLTNVISIYQWYINCYGDEMKDKTNLFTAITTNEAYIGLTHPMVKVNDDPKKLVPDYGYRYFTEDVPYGMVVLKGIYQVVGVPTPVNDKVLAWMQSKLGREYLKDGTISGKDVPTSRAPQRYGFNSLESLLGK